MSTNSEMEAFDHKHDHRSLAGGNGYDFSERIRGNQCEMSGMDYLVAMIRGELPMPPFMTTLGLDQITPQVEPGKIVVPRSPRVTLQRDRHCAWRRYFYSARCTNPQPSF